MIAVVDYHKGNLKSVERGLIGVGGDARITDDAAAIAAARAIVEADPAVQKAGGILTMYFGPQSMLMTVDVTFVPDIDDAGIIAATERVEAALVARFPQATRIYIEAEDLAEVGRQRQAQAAMPIE